MGKITDALKKVADDRLQRIQKSPDVQYVVKRAENTKFDEHIVSFHDPASPIGEQYKILRTNIQALKYKEGCKVFLVSSSINGEGKTVTSINLAISMAHDLNGKSVLLVDADMRKGSVARYLGLNKTPGLSDVLKGERTEEAVLVNPGIDNLTILLSGKAPKNPSELLNTKTMEKLIAGLKTKYDYIFIDTPPIMTLADATILAPMVDGVILVIQAGRTQRDIVKNSETRLLQAHAKIAGYIMTNIEYHLPHYLYRYVHKYEAYGDYHADKSAQEKVEAGV